MPRLPDINDLGSRPIPQSRARFVPSANPMEGLAQGLGALAKAGEQIEARMDRAVLSEKDTELTTATNSLLLDPENGALNRRGKDAIGASKKTLEEFDKRAGEISSGLTSRTQREAFQERIRSLRSGVESNLLRHESQEREQYFDDTDKARLETSVETAALTPDDPMKIAGELSLQRLIITGLAKRKGLDEVSAARAVAEAEDKTHEAVIGRFLLGNQYADASRYLATNQPRMQDATVEKLQRQILEDEELSLRALDLQQKTVNENVVKDGDRLLSQGQLSSRWIEQNRDALTKEDYRYFYKQLRGGDDHELRDPMLYADLREKAGLGQDIREEARNALRRGQIRSGDFDRIIGEVEQQRPSWYKRGTEYISTMSGVSQLNPDPSAAQTKASMLDEWNDWAAEHPKATERDAQVAYQDIVSHNMLVQMAGLPSPKFMVGTRIQPDLAATAAATMKAHQEGRIDDTEYARQATLLKQWRSALQPQGTKP